MNLDKQINVIRENALQTHSLDVVDKHLLKYGDIYSDVMEEVERIKHTQGLDSWNPHLLGQNAIIDIEEILKYDDYDFVENAYIKVLGRPADKAGLQAFLAALNAGQLTKEEILRELAASDEGMQKGTILTGFKVLDSSEFLQYHDYRFLEMAYVLLFRRTVDERGLEIYLKQLRIGEISREEVLYILKNSPEGQARELQIIGWDKICKLYKKRSIRRILLKVPVVGSLVKFCLNLLRLNRRINELSLKGYALDERLEKQAFEATKSTEEARGQLAQITGQVECLKCRMSESQKCFEEIEKHTNEQTTRFEKVEKIIGENIRKNEQTQKSFNELQNYTTQIGSNVHDINTSLEGLEKNVNDINGALGNYDKILGEYVNEDKKIIQTLLAEVYTLKARLSALEKNGVQMQNVQAESDKVNVSVSNNAENAYASIDYFDFENHFRGSREHVKKVQTIYLPYYEGKKNVLDLGCGRGEFTEMLVEQNVGVTGVDTYAPYVEYMKTLGLPVVHDDAVNYLREQEHVDGIFVGQVVEHISVGQIMGLCQLAYEKLEEGCYLIMETPNPTSLAIYTESFYMDPSHQKPVHPQTLKYIAEKAGFSSVEILYTQSSRMPFEIPKLKEHDEDFQAFNEAMSRVSNTLYGSQDYAIIARK